MNLLQPQDRRSKAPGDSAEAVAARRRFFDRGLADDLVGAIVEALPLTAADALLDAGCGEGHHLGAFRGAYGMEGHGVDISLPAIEAAAKRYRDCTWAVANADRFLPYPDASFTAVTSITARLNPTEFRRVLRKDGRLLVVIPGADDLIELREAIQGERVARDRSDRTVEMFAAQFALESRGTIARVVPLDPEAMADVLTSSYRGLRTRELERLATLEAMNVTLARDLLLFKPV